jgi:hypothetical protein
MVSVFIGDRDLHQSVARTVAMLMLVDMNKKITDMTTRFTLQATVVPPARWAHYWFYLTQEIRVEVFWVVMHSV